MKNRIREILSARGMSQKELAQGIGMSEIGLSRALDGSASKATITKVSSFLKVPEEEIITLDGNMPKALYEGELHLGDKILSCAVLDNGLRILSATAVFEAFDRPRKGKSNEGYRADQMPSFINANNLQPFVDEQLMEWTRLIEYTDLRGVTRQGYNARILRGLCKVYMDARRSGALLKSQMRFAIIAESLLLALSDVGIVALINEATGYDRVIDRAKNELQRFLKESLREEAGKWVKTFNEDFFEMIYRMNGWNWTGATTHPGVVGRWINDIVYERVAPKLLDELRKRNPKNENGNRSYKHHQFLTDEVGHPKLKEHIAGVMAIGRLSGNNWQRFMRNLDRAYPKWYTTPELDLDWDDED